MKWEKLGRIFHSNGQKPWMHSHAAVPIPLHLNGDFYRIYFATRDPQNHPHINYIEIDINSPDRVLKISENYVLGPGPSGYFDDNGVYPACIIEHNKKIFMYYLGRNNSAPPLYYMAIGLAVSEDRGKTFQRLFKAPIMARSEFDPWMVSTPFVIREEGIWRMWYLSGLGWDKATENFRSYYHIKYAESEDGITWKRHGLVCIDLQKGETNIASPSVIKENSIYKMWYSYVSGSKGYRVGYAESSNGYTWIRKDDRVGIDISSSGWDSKAMAYPYVFIHKGKKYMLYSGNGFGLEGFGMAIHA
jgi:predicted GH43/DUF377 family glycosyl hydrolase